MPQVDAFAAAGLDLWFNSDDHRPPHFHAEKVGEWEVRGFFMRHPSEMFETVWTAMKSRPRKGDLKALAKLAEAHRAALLEEWNLKVNVKEPGAEE